MGQTSSRAAFATGAAVLLGLLAPQLMTRHAATLPTPSTGSAVVETTGGTVRGLHQTGYDEWLGIPYAAPPTGSLRWTAPRPAAWHGIRDATTFSHRCVQGSGWDPGYENPTLTEDCLSLNVYAPAGAKGKRPVLVWIHGGGFTGGAGQDTDPRKFVQQTGAVYVTINYRLGALGFLNLPQLGTPAGTFGLLDQQAALRWVQRNIARFGGDARNVTIAGQSAGGSSVCDQLASPTARGLFARAVIMSGGCSLSSTASAQQASLAFVREAGCASATDVVACLRAKPAADLLAAQQRAGVRPSVGGAAFPADPAVAVPAGNFNRVPVLIGQVNNERALFTFQTYDYLGKPLTAAQYVALVQSTYGANAARVLAEYPVSAYPTPGEAWTAVGNDSTATVREGVITALSNYVPTYGYEFSESDTPQFTSIYLIQQKSAAARSFPFGATHVDDLGYLWEYLGQTLPYDDDELELSTQMISYWGRFAGSGDPNGERTPAWPRYHAAGASMMFLKACDTAPASGDSPAACSRAGDHFDPEHHTAFWRSLT